MQCSTAEDACSRVPSSRAAITPSLAKDLWCSYPAAGSHVGFGQFFSAAILVEGDLMPDGVVRRG